MKKYIINGKFLLQSTTGVQRFAYEIMLAIDSLSLQNIELALPVGVKPPKEVKNMKIVFLPYFLGSFFWEQVVFSIYTLLTNKISINLCNITPIINPGVTCVHDVNCLRNPSFFSIIFNAWYRINYFVTMRSRYPVLTVSNFSKEEIIFYYPKRKDDSVHVIYNSWEHFNRISEDESIFENLPSFFREDFFLSLSSITPNKNFNWIYNNALLYPRNKYIIIGGSNSKVFTQMNIKKLPNVYFTGYLNDSQIKALMKRCKAFIFPSFYEGFGIPPLEALSCGAKIVVSHTSAMPEVMKDCANYINPFDSTFNLNDNLIFNNYILNYYSWISSAKKLCSLLNII